jgi:hypothetical protein
MGYGAGLVKNRTLAPTIAVALAFSAIVLVIQDMEWPRTLLFTISQEPHAARRISPPSSCAEFR